MPFLPDGTQLYTHNQGVALDYQAFTLATSMQGRLRAEVGGPFLQMYDLNLTPISFVTTNADTGGFPVVYATAARAVWDFGSVQLPSVSTESLAAGEEARALAEQAVAAAQAALDRLDNLLAGGVGDGSGSIVPSDASAAIKGILRLGGDLGGTADAPTVPGLVAARDRGNHTGTQAMATIDGLAAALAGKAPTGSYVNSADFTNLTNALNLLTRRVTALEGATGTSPDVTPPEATLTTPPAGSSVNQPFTIGGTYTDA